MNIGFDAKRAFHNSRGLGNYSRDTIRLLTSYFPNNNYLLFNPKSKNNIHFPYANNAHEINPLSLFGKLFPSWWRSKGMVKQLGDKRLDIFHGLSQELPLGIEKTGIKTIVTMHDAIFMRYPELYPASYRTVFIKKNKHACRIADRIIAISEQTKQDLVCYFNANEKKIDVVYQGCSNIFREKVSKEQKEAVQKKYDLPKEYILNVGAIEKRKNAGAIIEALFLKNIDIPLVLVGKPTEYIKEINSLIQKYDMIDQVCFLHNVETTDLPAIYDSSKIFIYPSIFEGFGIPILEALCSGTPVIASSGTCFEEVGGPDSLYINPYNPIELGNAISLILNATTLQEKMIHAGHLFSENFRDEKVAHNLMEVYLK